MNFITDTIRSCAQCQMALSDTNTTGFCTTFCENEYHGVTNKTVPEKVYAGGNAIKGIRVKPKKAYETEMQKFLKRVKH